MKKLLSILLAIVMLGMSVAVGASALDIDEQNLGFELPVVTGISADWDGTASGWMWPQFSPENVEVTVTFDDSTTQVLTNWWDEGSNWWWEVWASPDFDANIVTVYYADSRIYAELMDDHDCCCDVDWDAFMATLPQDYFELPDDFLEDWLANLDAVVMTLNQRVNNVGSVGVLSFTPETSGQFHFFTQWGDFDFVIYDSNFNFVDWGEVWPGRGQTVWLEEGITYFIMIDWMFDDGCLTVTDQIPQPPRPNFFQRIIQRMESTLFGRLVLAPFYAVGMLITWPLQAMHTLLHWILFGWWW